MKSIEELKISAADGDAESLFQLGLHYANEAMKSNDIDSLANAAHMYAQAAEKDNTHVEAKRQLALLHASGIPFPNADPNIAVQLFKEIGDKQAKFELGFLYCDGRRIPKNAREGRRLIEEVMRESKVEDFPHFFVSRLADIYCRGGLRENGDPTVDDLVKAIKYLKRSLELALIDNKKEYIELGRQQLENQYNRLSLKPKMENIDNEYIITKLKENQLEDVATKLMIQWNEEKENERRIILLEQEEKERQYQNLLERYQIASSENELEAVSNELRLMNGYKDSANLAETCEHNLNELVLKRIEYEKEQKIERERIAAEDRKRAIKNGKIAIVVQIGLALISLSLIPSILGGIENSNGGGGEMILAILAPPLITPIILGIISRVAHDHYSVRGFKKGVMALIVIWFLTHTTWIITSSVTSAGQAASDGGFVGGIIAICVISSLLCIPGCVILWKN